MTKLEFFEALRRELSDLPEEERARSIGYFSEMIADRMEDGMSEEEAVADIGNPKEIAEQILLEMSLPKLVHNKIQRERKRGGVFSTVLLILGSPVWLPLLFALFAVLLSVYVVIWSVIVSLFAAVVGVGCGGLFLLIAPIFIPFTNVGGALISLGSGTVCISLAIFGFLGSIYVAKVLVWFSGFLLRKLKGLFIHQKEVA